MQFLSDIYRPKSCSCNTQKWLLFCVVSSDLAILPTLTYTYGDIPSLGAILSTFASPSTRPPKVKVKTLKTNKKQADVAEVSARERTLIQKMQFRTKKFWKKFFKKTLVRYYCASTYPHALFFAPFFQFWDHCQLGMRSDKCTIVSLYSIFRC